jgi:hypothetical protein
MTKLDTARIATIGRRSARWPLGRIDRTGGPHQ